MVGYSAEVNSVFIATNEAISTMNLLKIMNP